MKKKKIIFAGMFTVVVAIAVGVLFISSQSRKIDPNSLLAQNLEMLVQGSTPGESTQILVGYYWYCPDGGVVETVCEIDGQVSVMGTTVSGSYTKGGKYSFAWARYTCEPTEPYKNDIQCDAYQIGIYVDGKKVS